ncbi:hypothetical protein [Actinomadura harenae]|uniref:DUF3168 domain-containing protein n=1 Tax=Actinomadura harenae TaxID=2483351 RepID=A0A3M2LSN8_9ACTN|nr:hypothetical protein [Actinomadura harenae]RMI39880.1 hypothetical protein EBO15_28345 [Actinomadura harenae]
MATVTEQRDRIAVVLAGVDGLKMVVKHPAESAPSVRPAVVLGEPTAIFAEGEARRGLDSWDWPLLILVSLGDYPAAQQVMDAFLNTGPGSIRQAFLEEPGLGLLDGTHAVIDRMDDYGPRDSGDGTRMVGAVLHLVVRTTT